MPKKISDSDQKKFVEEFKRGSTIKEIAKKYSLSNFTITKYIKRLLGESLYIDIMKDPKSSDGSHLSKDKDKKKSYITDPRDNSIISPNYENPKNVKTKKNPEDEGSFVEIAPLNYEFNYENQKELSSIPISEANFPDVVYMIVDKKIELEIKYLRDYPDWQFLSKDD